MNDVYKVASNLESLVKVSQRGTISQEAWQALYEAMRKGVYEQAQETLEIFSEMYEEKAQHALHVSQAMNNFKQTVLRKIREEKEEEIRNKKF